MGHQGPPLTDERGPHVWQMGGMNTIYVHAWKVDTYRAADDTLDVLSRYIGLQLAPYMD